MLQSEEAIYGLAHPTIDRIIKKQGFEAACIWVRDHLRNMFALSSFSPEEKMLKDLTRSVTVRYKHLMLPEFMHFCFLYRTGEFARTMLKPDGENVLRGLREYSRMRESILANLAQKSSMPDTTDRHPMTPEIARMIEDFLAAEALRQDNWRQEPWGTAICRAHFVDKTLATFPGDMTPEERRQWAARQGLTAG